MTTQSTPPVVLVTGGAVRVGRALSLGFAEAGYDVAINYRSSAEEARSARTRIEEMGRKAVLAPGDVARSEDVKSVVERVRSTFGRLDVLINNASLFEAAPLLDVSEEEWDRVMAVNLKGPFLLVRESADLLREGEGSVINIVDNSAFQAWVEHPHHSVSKAALLHLTKVMARSLAPEIRVNAIAPGPVLLPESYSEEQRRRAKESTLVGRLGSPRDVVRTALFLVESSFTTGTCVVVDGGRQVSGARRED